MASYSDLHGKSVLVTGGAKGIGNALVRAFHAQGARVFFCDTEVRAGRALAKALRVRAVFHQVDLGDESQIVRWIDGVAERVSTLHVLINNAARDPRQPLGRMSALDWDRLFAINLRACFLTAREVVKHMRRGDGSIINLSSLTFHLGPAQMSAYVATKGGIIGLTRSLARELGPRRLRVNTVSPGWVMTERQLRQFVTPSVKKRIRQAQCIPDLLRPEDIANVVLFLASDASRAITGQEILADRGWAHA